MKNRRFSFFPRNGKSEDCFSEEKSGGCAKYPDLKMEFQFFPEMEKGVLAHQSLQIITLHLPGVMRSTKYDSNPIITTLIQ